MRRRMLLIFMLLLTLISSYGCKFSPPAYSATDGTNLGANSNCPDRAAFGNIVENVPIFEATVSSPILFRWYYRSAVGWPYPSDWSDECVPTGFTLYLSPGPFYNTVLSFPVAPFTVDVNPSSLLYRFYLNNQLQPGTSYRWMVVGHAEGIDIDDDQLPLLNVEKNAWILGTLNGLFQTPQTGPACTSQTIGSANLIYPQDGEVLPDDTPYFQWDMPNCSSEAYSIIFDTEPQMASPFIGWVTNKEGFLISPNQFQPCTTYYWQVKAGVYSMEYHMNLGGWATSSEIRSFSIQSPTCSSATLSVNGFCRLGPGTNYPAAAVFEAGYEVSLEARSESLTPLWWYVSDLPSALQCWISDAILETEIAPESLMAMEAPPVPEPVADEGAASGDAGSEQVGCHKDLTPEQCIQVDGTWYAPLNVNTKPFCLCPE